jgi:hypothetical protein
MRLGRSARARPRRAARAAPTAAAARRGGHAPRRGRASPAARGGRVMVFRGWCLVCLSWVARRCSSSGLSPASHPTGQPHLQQLRALPVVPQNGRVRRLRQRRQQRRVRRAAATRRRRALCHQPQCKGHELGRARHEVADHWVLLGVDGGDGDGLGQHHEGGACLHVARGDEPDALRRAATRCLEALGLQRRGRRAMRGREPRLQLRDGRELVCRRVERGAVRGGGRRDGGAAATGRARCWR